MKLSKNMLSTNLLSGGVFIVVHCSQSSANKHGSMTSNKNILMPTKINNNTHYLYWYILGQYLLESELKFSISPKEKKFVGWGGPFLIRGQEMRKSQYRQNTSQYQTKSQSAEHNCT